MKNLFSYIKFLMLPIFNLLSFIAFFYFSIIFLLILIINEAISGKPNEMLKEDFSAFIQKISNFPGSIYSPAEKQEMDWLKRLS